MNPNLAESCTVTELDHIPRRIEPGWAASDVAGSGEATVQPIAAAAAEAARSANKMFDGDEVIVLQIRPGIAYIVISCLGSLFGIAFLVVLLAYLTRIPILTRSFVTWSEVDAIVFGILLVTVRLGWQAMDWWCRLYVLTDRRIVSMSGILRRAFYQAPLRNIQHLAVVRNVPERLTALGSIAFATAGSDRYDTIWLSVAKSFEVHRTVVKTIERYGRNQNLD
ncbi:MAG: PH domain-containing protein [Planctomycetes bacterium]|nr:PH domain-containing protein [Planctomycetota bacterium]NOG54246.1 PH domain-containing protein [Planctomycetota bacterium]